MNKLNQTIIEDKQTLLEVLPWLKDKAPEELIKIHSRTFRFATKLFPANIASRIKVVYAFVRVADDLVDIEPPLRPINSKLFSAYKNLYFQAALTKEKVGIPVIDEFASLASQLNFQDEWVESFFMAMEKDLNADLRIKTEEDLLSYTYGSAAVIGFMCASIFGIKDKEAFQQAGKLGDAFQQINFIRDLRDDTVRLSRSYYPTSDFISIGIEKPKTAAEVINLNPIIFNKLIFIQLQRYENWLNYGLKGINAILEKSPRAALAVLAAAILYQKTAQRIYANPELIKQNKIGPSQFDKFTAIIRPFIYLLHLVFKRNFKPEFFQLGTNKAELE